MRDLPPQQHPLPLSNKRSSESASSSSKRPRALPPGVEPLSGRAQPFALPEGWQTGFKFLGQRFFLWYIVDFVEGDCDEVGLNNSELPALPDSFCVPFSGFLTVV